MIGVHDLDTLQAQLEAAPDTRRASRARDYLRLALNVTAARSKDTERLRVCYLELVRAMLVTGLADQPELPAPFTAPVQTAVTPAKTIARFFADDKRPKPDSCKGAKGVWGRAAKGVI